ncbi:MAG: NADPH:quinone oxidoreductase family protein [Myxococcota bacterium]
MKAIVCKAFGPPADLTLEDDVPTPEPGASQVRISVHAAGCNYPDFLMVQGLYQFKPPFPFSPGAEVAGVVSAVGDGVQGIEVGDRVLATIMWGGFAEEVVAESSAVVKLPEDFGFNEASGFLLTYATSLYALADRGHLKAGQTLLVLGAAGGVGLAAVQIGKAMGARVIAAASSAEKLALCKEAGADEVINYAEEDLKTRAKALTNGNGADVIYDPVGGAFAEPALRAIAWEGRYLVIGFAAGDIPKIPLNLPLLKGCDIVGVFWGSFMMRNPAGHQAHINTLLEMWRKGEVKPVVSQVYPLAEASKALEDLGARRAKGKIVISVR